MHILAALFTLLFSFGHAASIRHHATEALYGPTITSVEFAAPRAAIEHASTSYPESECLSCRRTNVTYSVR